MDSSARREGRLVATGIGVFILAMLLIFAGVARVAFYQLDRIYGELEEFTETEISLTRILTRVQQAQSERHLALERMMRVRAEGGTALDASTGAIPLFRERSMIIHHELGRGLAIARAAATISSDAAEEYAHIQELMLQLRTEHERFEVEAWKLIESFEGGATHPPRDLLNALARAAQSTSREAEDLLIELESFMEETGWELEAHSRDSIETIGLVSAVGAVLALIFGAYVLVSTFSHMETRRRVEEALLSSKARHQADLSTLQDSAAELAMIEGEAEIGRYVERELESALDLEWVKIRLAPDEGEGGDVTEPVGFLGERLATLCCGPKLSGEPFSPEERRLLKSIAEQMAVALHNAQTIQALREANEELLRNARLVAVGEFAAAVAHGVRNPLAAIRAAAQAAHKRAQKGASSDSLAMIMREADRLDHRIRSLLDFSRPRKLFLRTTDLRSVVQAVSQTIERLPEAAKTKVITDLPPDPAEWEVDPDYIEEALLELAGNALRSMPNGGELILRVEHDPHRLAISVEDTGHGIPSGVRDRVFDLFFTAHPEGTGMGLATVKKIIEGHGGTLALERTGPEGTLFRIELLS